MALPNLNAVIARVHKVAEQRIAAPKLEKVASPEFTIDVARELYKVASYLRATPDTDTITYGDVLSLGRELLP